MLQDNNEMQALPPFVITSFCGYADHIPGTWHAWNVFVLAKKLLITLWCSLQNLEKLPQEVVRG